MQSRAVGLVHVGLAAGATLLSVWLADVSLELEVAAVLGGLSLGALAGMASARSIERRVDGGGGVVLYAEDSPPHAFMAPLATLALSPFALGTMMLVVAASSEVRFVLQVILCALAAAWFGHDLLVSRRLRRMSADRCSLQVQWFHGRSVVGAEAMIGKRGNVTTACAPGGYVRIGGELWRAESIDGSTLSEGQEVIVRRLNGLVLLVEPARDSIERAQRREQAAPRAWWRRRIKE